MVKINLDFMAGAVVGFGAGVFSRELVPAAADGIKPLAKTTIKAGIVSVERAVEGLSRLREGIEDLVAEAREEVLEGKEAKAHGEEEETPSVVSARAAAGSPSGFAGRGGAAKESA